MFGASKTKIGEIRGEEKEGGTQRAEVGLRVRVVCLPVVCGNNHWKTIYIVILRSYIVYACTTMCPKNKGRCGAQGWSNVCSSRKQTLGEDLGTYIVYNVSQKQGQMWGSG